MNPVFVLHQRKYRDTSLLVEVFSRNEGRYPLIVRGARSSKKRTAALMQPFQPLLVEVHGHGELRTAGSVEGAGATFVLEGDNLMLGLYVNELLYRSVGRFESLPQLFDGYLRLLGVLSITHEVRLALREFELLLLAELGYGVVFDSDAGKGEPVREEAQYRYVVQDGFHECQPGETGIAGSDLLAIAEGGLQDEGERIVRQVVRQSLTPVLGGKPLKSRALFERST